MPKSETVTLLKSLDHRVTGLGDHVNSLDHQVTRLGDQVNSLDHQVSGLGDQVNSLDHQVSGLGDQVRNLDHRVGVIERILPTLATKDDLKDFPTEADPKGFATKQDVLEEGQQSRRYMKVLVEDLRDTVNRALDGNLGHAHRLEEDRVRLDGHDAAIGAIEVRVTAVERPSRRNR